MRSRIFAAALAVVAIGGGTAFAGDQGPGPHIGDTFTESGGQGEVTPYSCDGQTLQHHRHRGRALVQRGYDLDRLPAKDPMKRREVRAFQEHKRCISHPPVREHLADYREKYADRYKRHRTLLLTSRCGSPTCNRVLAQSELGLSGSEWSCADALWEHESHWEETARNPSSGAYGIPQALPPEKMGAAAQGSGWEAALAQIEWGEGYVYGRYGSFCGAWGHFTANNWY